MFIFTISHECTINQCRKQSLGIPKNAAETYGKSTNKFFHHYFVSYICNNWRRFQLITVMLHIYLS